jgi:hypothetical protein
MISSTIGLASKTMIFAQFAVLLLSLFDLQSERQADARSQSEGIDARPAKVWTD